MTIDWRGSSYEDIRRLITSEASKACRMFGIDFQQNGEDVMQDCWAVVLRKLPVYEDRGYKVTTFLFPYIRRDARAACFKIRRAGGVQIPTEAEFLQDRPSPEVQLPQMLVDLDSTSDILFLQAAGYDDTEIAEILEQDVKSVTAQRHRDRKELLGTCPS